MDTSDFIYLLYLYTAKTCCSNRYNNKNTKEQITRKEKPIMNIIITSVTITSTVNEIVYM